MELVRAILSPALYLGSLIVVIFSTWAVLDMGYLGMCWLDKMFDRLKNNIRKMKVE